MKRFLLLFFVFLAFSGFSRETYLESNNILVHNNMNDSKTDTIYYNFYNDVQMIEIIYSFPPSLKAIDEYHRRASMMSSIPPPPHSYSFSVYIFRNRQGEIVSVFNQKKEKINANDFIPVEKIEDGVFPHKHNFRKELISESLTVIPSIPSYWHGYESNSSTKTTDIYFIYDIQSLSSGSIPKDFSKLTNEEHTLLTSTKKGMIDTLGNMIINPIYDQISVYDSVLILKKDEKYSFMNRTTRELSLEHNQYKAIPTNPTLYAVESEDLWGFLNSKGQLLMNPTYTYFNYFSLREYSEEYKYLRVVKDTKQGLLDTQLNEIFPTEFYNIVVYQLEDEDYFIVTQNEKTGVFNEQLSPIIPIKYDKIYPSMKRNSFIVEENEKQGVIDLEGKILFPTEYKIRGFGNDIYLLYKGDKYGIFDTDMNEIYPIELEGQLKREKINRESPFFFMKKEGKTGVFNNENKTFLEPKYDRIFFYPNSSYFTIQLNEKRGVLDFNFKEIIAPNYDLVGKVNIPKNRYIVQNNRKWGVIDSTGQVIIPFDYDQIRELDKGDEIQYEVRIGRKIGIIDSVNNVILPCEFEQMKSSVNAKYYIMKFQNKYGAYDIRGNELIAPIYEHWIWIPYSSRYYVSIKGKWGVINPGNLELVVPIKFRNRNCIPCKYAKAIFDSEILNIKCRRQFLFFGRTRVLLEFKPGFQ